MTKDSATKDKTLVFRKDRNPTESKRVTTEGAGSVEGRGFRGCTH